MVAAAPAAAQEVEWWRTSNATLYRDAKGCSAVTIGLDGLRMVMREETDGGLSLRVTGKAWKPRDSAYALRLNATGSPGPGITAEARGVRDDTGWNGFELPITTAQLTQLGPYTTIDIYDARYDARQETVLATVANPAIASTLRHRCAVEVSRIDRGSGKPAVTRATIPPDLPPLVTNDDYPASAIRAEQQGTTFISITVSAKGMVSDCSLQSSSGSQTLDQTACSILSRRARFQPALDADGQPTEDRFVTPFHWVLPAG